MRIARLVCLAICCAAVRAQMLNVTGQTLVVQVKERAVAGDLNSARRELERFKAARGITPEYLEALSWLGRGELALKDYVGAEANSAEVHKLAVAQLTRRKLDADSSLPVALGASIETQALASALQGRRTEAVSFLEAERARWRDTSIRTRIQKNLNLLTLEGKPAPELGNARLAAYRGRPVLLFFWAHWCSDCKNEIAVVQRLEKAYGGRGLAVVAPTQHYGYVAGGQDAARAVETKYIHQIFAAYYSGLGPVETPISEETFARYGVSTTPTLVLVDAQGIVRLYHPGNLSFEQLAARIEPLLGKTKVKT